MATMVGMSMCCLKKRSQPPVAASRESPLAAYAKSAFLASRCAADTRESLLYTHCLR